jgi:outer membrane usher protein
VRALKARRRALAGAAVTVTVAACNALSMELDRRLGVTPSPRAAPPAESAPASMLLKLTPALAERARGRYPRATQPLIVTLTVNADPRGERIVRMNDAGEFLARAEDLAVVTASARVDKVYDIEGEAFVEVSAAGARARFDEKALALEITFPAERLPPQRFDLSTRLGEVDIDAPPRSVLLNYRFGYTGTRGAGDGTLSLSADAAAAYGDWLVRNQSFHSRSSGETTSIRLETQAIRDDRENLRRLTLGDATTPGLALGSAVPFAGITLAKAYALSPYLSRQPSVGYQGIAEFPSQVDFYVGNTLVMRQRVAPGPFAIENFTYYGGQRDVRVVIRDVFGRERTVAYPFYFAAEGLAAGLHDYSYQAGWLRRGLGTRSNDYGPFAISAFHQLGLDDVWTIGARGEATSRLANGGIDLIHRSERFGISAAHAGLSRERDGAASGHAVSLSHTYLRGEMSAQLIWQRFSPEYSILATDIAPRLPRSDLSFNLAYSTPRLGSASLGFTRLELPDSAPARSVNAAYSRPLWGRFNLTATARRQLTEPRGNELFLGLQYIPRANETANLSWRHDVGGVRTSSLQWANQVPHGEGVAYAINLQQQAGGGETTRLISPRLDWYARHAAVGIEVNQLNGASTGSTTGYSLSLAGAIASAEGRFALARPVADSFAIVEIQPPIAGVSVYENSQEAGRTGDDGRLLLPNIAAYANNYASLRDKDVPIEYSIDRVGHSFSPPMRSGTLVPFAIRRLRTFTGRFVYREDGAVKPLGYALVRIETAAGEIEAATAKNGEFYAENLASGTHRAAVVSGAAACKFAFEVPAGDAPQVALGDIMACHVAR